MTELPSETELVRLKETNFSNLRCYESIISCLFHSKQISIIDYGCSWGYNVFKLINSGYNAMGFEVSKPRAIFGSQNLNVSISSDESEIPSDLDLFLSSHVIEHLADLNAFINTSKAKLKDNGLFMAFCPNGNHEYRERELNTWHGSWGDIHVNLIDSEFAAEAFKNHPYLILSGDWKFNLSKIKQWDQKSQVIDDYKAGKELLIVACPNKTI